MAIDIVAMIAVPQYQSPGVVPLLTVPKKFAPDFVSQMVVH